MPGLGDSGFIQLSVSHELSTRRIEDARVVVLRRLLESRCRPFIPQKEVVKRTLRLRIR